MKRIVITGALGYVGSFLIQKLCKDYPQMNLCLIDDLSTGSLRALPESASIELHKKNILNLRIESLLKDADAVIHLAAQVDAEKSHLYAKDLEERNIECTRQIAESCKRLNLPLFFPSTTSVYGQNGIELKEDMAWDHLNPQTAYAASKLECEKIILESFAGKSRPGIIFRWASIFGMAPVFHERTAIHKLCGQALRGQPLSIWETALHQTRPYLTLSDAVGAILHLLQIGQFDGKIYNIASFHAHLDEIISAIKNNLQKIETQRVKSVAMNDVSYTLSTERIRSLGFKPKGDLPADMEKLLRDWKKKI